MKQLEERERTINDIARELGVPLDNIPSYLFFTPSEIERMNREGLIEFGSNTLSHPSLVNVTAEEAGTEISESKEKIETLTGTEVTSFCYPYGHFSDDTKALVARAGYRSATTTRYGLNAENIDPFELKRVGIRDLRLCVFAAELSGV